MILNKINNPKDLKKLNIKEKIELSSELREMIIDESLKNEGHLSSNLGVIELTIALYSAVNLPKDKVIWDVGHQTYAHKIITGRKEKFKTIRKKDGISGFPKTSESEYDAFDVGHSSTSISVALGMARARDILKKDEKIYAIIGDGAITGGMALEALNDAGISNTNITIILNDNEMSISKNTGGFSKFLSKLRTRKLYIKSNSKIKKITKKMPLGNNIITLVEWSKKRIKGLIIKNMFFENIGFTYLGPVDGHNIEAMIDLFKRSENIKGPKLIHVITKKGKGYKKAEENPNKYHMISNSKSKDNYSKIMGKKLTELARKNNKIVAITAAMEDGTGLCEFRKEYPNRFFDVEIAEQHALTMAAGMAKAGLKPVVPIYSSFLQRGYDQIVHDIAIQNLQVVICVDRAGIVGTDGETHHGLLDIAFLSTIPNMTIMSPKNYEELEMMLEYAINHNGPVAIRYPRGGENYKFNKSKKIINGESEIIKKGEDVTILAAGKMVGKAMEVSKKLKKDNINSEIINARFLKPIDTKTIQKSLDKTKMLITIEDGNVTSGFGSKVKANLKTDKKIITLGYPDKFIEHAKVDEIEEKYNLDVNSIYKLIKDNFK